MDKTGAPTAAGAADARSNPLDQYEVIQVIGKGSFGTVSKIKRRSDSKTLVWKELNYGAMREKEKALIVSEVNILRELRHPFIVRYYDRIVDKAASRLYIIMEFCEGGDLGAMIKRAKKDGTSIDEEFIWKVFTQMAVALKECHRHKEAAGKTKPIVHRDLKPGNIFLDAQGNIKIGDFGLAKELASESKFASTNVGTPFYMSPEMINEQTYNEKSDIWALGCLLFELAALVPPFEATNHLNLAVKINAGKFNRVPLKYSDDLHRAIRWMLQTDATKRPAVEDLEKVPRVRATLDKALGVVAAYNNAMARPVSVHVPTARPSTADPADVSRREAALLVREAEVSRRETAVAARTVEVARREAAVLAREREVAVPSSRPSTASSTTSVLSLPVGTGAAVPGGQHPHLHRAFTAGDLPGHMAKLGLGMARPGSAQGVAASGGAIPTVSVSIAGHGRGIPTASINLGGMGGSSPDDTQANPMPPSSSPDPMDADPHQHMLPAQAFTTRPAAVNGLGIPRPAATSANAQGQVPSKLQAMAALGGIVLGGDRQQSEGPTYVPRAL